MNGKEFKRKWCDTIKKNLKNFPGDFLENLETVEINLPGKILIPGAELFGNYEILDAESNPVMQTESKYKQKYILYAHRNNRGKIKIPADEKYIEKLVKTYEQHLFGFLKNMKAEYKENFHTLKNFNEISASVFNSLNLHLY